MESNKLTVLENKLPFRAYPENELDKVLETVFKYWLANLLSIKADNEEKLNLAIPAIKNHFWSLGFDEVKKAFEMYADGKLSTKPIPNYFDRILVGQIFNDYRASQRTKVRPTQDFDKENRDYIYCVTAFDYFIQNGALPEQAVWLYEYLTTYKGVLRVSNEEIKKAHSLALDKYQNDDMATLKAKLWLVEHYFNTLHVKNKHIKNEI